MSLHPKHKRFVDHFLKYGDRRAAYVHAGYDVTTAASCHNGAARILSRPDVKAYLMAVRAGAAEVPAAPLPAAEPLVNPAAEIRAEEYTAVREADLRRPGPAVVDQEADDSEKQRILDAAVRLNAEWVMRELGCIAFSDIGEVLDFTGPSVRLREAWRVPVHARRAIKSVKVKRYLEGRSREVEVVEFSFWDKVAALKTLAEAVGALKGGNPLERMLEDLKAVDPELAAAAREMLLKPESTAGQVGEVVRLDGGMRQIASGGHDADGVQLGGEGPQGTAAS